MVFQIKKEFSHFIETELTQHKVFFVKNLYIALKDTSIVKCDVKFKKILEGYECIFYFTHLTTDVSQKTITSYKGIKHLITRINNYILKLQTCTKCKSMTTKKICSNCNFTEFYTQSLNEICCICHENLGPGIVKTRCNHIYHKVCLHELKERSNKCPMCRTFF